MLTGALQMHLQRLVECQEHTEVTLSQVFLVLSFSLPVELCTLAGTLQKHMQWMLLCQEHTSVTILQTQS